MNSAQKYAPLREDGLAEIGLAYPLIRQMLLEVGRRFAQSRVIPACEDIFWLAEEEIRSTAARMDAGLTAASLAEKIPQRKAEHQAALRATPPRMLPQMKLFGFDLASLKAKRGRGDKGATIKGVAWTPLFAMASAIVTDVGGPLSHGSIVAREYRIPAVLGTGSATRRIQTGQTITVDGSAGTVVLHTL